MAGAGLRGFIAERAPMENICQAGYAELGLVNFLALLGGQRKLVRIPVLEFGAGNGGELLLRECPVRPAFAFGAAVKAQLATPVAPIPFFCA